MSPIEPNSLWLGTPRSLGQHYEAQALNTLALLWRNKRIIALCSVVALLLSGLAIFWIGKRYTADVMVEPKLERNDAPKIGAQSPLPAVAIDAASLIETEVRILRSRGIAQRVATRLDLKNDPDFAIPNIPGSSAETLIAAQLQQSLRVTSDSRSYVISISFTSTSPVKAAHIANTFAEEYLKARREAAARRELTEVATIYGSRHPAYIRAQAALDISKDADTAGLVRADPAVLTPSPSRTLILGLAMLGGLAAGVGIVLLRDRTHAGYRTDTELAADTGLPCLAMLPEVGGDTLPGATYVSAEATRAIAAAAGLTANEADSKVVLITSSISDEGKSLLSAMIAKTFVTMEKRALIIDMSPQGAAGRGRPTSRPLEEILNGIELGLPPPFEPMRRQRLTMLHRSTGIDVSQRLVTSPVFAKLLAAARDSYDLVLIEAPPVMLCADALYLGRFADLVLHVVRWNSTPRAAVAAAIRRMRHVDIRVEGVILSRVDHQEYLRCNGVDPQDYFRQHGATRALLPSRESMSQDEKAPAA